MACPGECSLCTHVRLRISGLIKERQEQEREMAVLHNNIIGPCFAGVAGEGTVSPSRLLTGEEEKGTPREEGSGEGAYMSRWCHSVARWGGSESAPKGSRGFGVFYDHRVCLIYG